MFVRWPARYRDEFCKMCQDTKALVAARSLVNLEAMERMRQMHRQHADEIVGVRMRSPRVPATLLRVHCSRFRPFVWSGIRGAAVLDGRCI